MLSPDNRNKIVSIIWHETNLFCEIIKEKDFFEIIFFDKNVYFEIEFNLFIKVITEAKEALDKKLSE